MPKGLVCIRLYNKYFETRCATKIIKHTLPDVDIVLFCNDDVDRLRELDLPVKDIVQVPPPNQRFINIAMQRSQSAIRCALTQVGDISLVARAYNYCKNKDYDYSICTSGDVWFVTNAIESKIVELLIDREIDFITQKKNGEIFPSTFLYRTDSDLFFDNLELVFHHYDFNIERTYMKIIKKLGYNVKLYDTPHKHGYIPNFGTFHYNTDKADGVAKYKEMYDEETDVILFNGDKDKYYPLD